MFWYLRSIVTQKVYYGLGLQRHLAMYLDTNQASQKLDQKSTSRGVAMLYSRLISQQSKVQHLVATLSTKSEYIVMLLIAKQSQQIAQILRDIGYVNYISLNLTTINICRDNQGTLALVKNPYLHEQSKHINICYYYIQDLTEQKRIIVIYILTNKIIIDRFTKLLRRTLFKRFKRQLSLQKQQELCLGLVWLNLAISVDYEN